MAKKESAKTEQSLTKKVWNMADVLAAAGVGFTDYITQLTYLLFLKMDQENVTWGGVESAVPEDCRWEKLLEVKMKGEDLVTRYNGILRTLSKESGLIGAIFIEAQNEEDKVFFQSVIQKWIDVHSGPKITLIKATEKRKDSL